MPYLFRAGFPAFLVEIYLPKKAGFQGTLYKTLVDAKNPDIVVDHITSHKNEIREMFEKEWELGRNKFTESFIKELSEEINKIYVGFSMYEVDGVFFGNDDAAPCEERTQVIRLIFEYPISEKLSNDVILEVKKFLRSPVRNLSEYDCCRTEYLNELSNVEDWIAKIGIFLIGFIVHRLTQAADSAPYLRQDEIWMTSFWSMVLNKFLPIKNL